MLGSLRFDALRFGYALTMLGLVLELRQKMHTKHGRTTYQNQH